MMGQAVVFSVMDNLLHGKRSRSAGQQYVERAVPAEPCRTLPYLLASRTFDGPDFR